MIDLRLPDGRPASMLLPEGDGPHPGVVVLHDITGFREDTRRHCRRFVEAGYAAIAPDLYDGGRAACVVSTLRSLVTGRGEALAGIDGARALLAARPEVDAARIGVIGFCMGGGFALLAGAAGGFAVAAPFYGPVPRRREALAGVCPVIAHFGAQDLTLWGQAGRLRRHLTGLGVPHAVHEVAGVGHSFVNDHRDALFSLGRFTPLRARYDAEAEAESWRRVLDFFARYAG